MKTYFAKKEDFGPENRTWYHVDAEGKVLGRMASEIATRLMGKDRPEYTPHVDTGAYVVVTNAEKVRLTGKKMSEKEYQRYSGYPGGRKVTPADEMLQEHPEEAVKLAIKRMMPKTRLGDKMLEKLKVYAGPDHPHGSQQPQTLEIE